MQPLTTWLKSNCCLLGEVVGFVREGYVRTCECVRDCVGVRVWVKSNSCLTEEQGWIL